MNSPGSPTNISVPSTTNTVMLSSPAVVGGASVLPPREFNQRENRAHFSDAGMNTLGCCLFHIAKPIPRGSLWGAFNTFQNFIVTGT